MEPYSEQNPVPTTQHYEAQQQAWDQESSSQNGQAHDSEETRKNHQEKEDMMDKMAGPKEKPTDKVKRRKGERTVKDPTTGLDVTIKDAKFEDVGGIIHPSKTAPSPARPGNISLQPYLPPAPVSLDALLRKLDLLQLGLAGGFGLVWLMLAFPEGRWWLPFTWPWLVWITRSIIIGGMGFAAVTSVSIVQRKLEKEVDRVRADMHRARGEKFAPPTPESVEWLNAFTRTIWGLVNPDIFVPIADMVEGTSAQSLPGFVDAVRISDIGQGSNPVRIVSMRALPDKPTDKEYPREEWIDQGTNTLLKQQEKARQEGKDIDQSGDYVNFEVAVSYQALPGQGDDRAKNIHLLCEFFLGLYDWLHIPIPIWIQVEGFVATVRLRMQFIPESPFIRNLTVTFMGVPAVEVSATPLSKILPNVLDLPLVSRFAKMAIAAATAEFVAPKSLTINVQDLLSTAAIGDTRAVGVFLITIHHGENLAAKDRNGKSDPYIVMAYAKFGKPLYSTRIILGDLNPCFEETAVLLLTQDEIKSDEELSVMLWDSDRRSADDLMGRIQIPVKKLIETPNQTFRRADKLMGYEDADSIEGTLHWSIGYYTKVPLRKDLERLPENPPEPKKTATEMEMRPGDKAPNPAARDLPPPPPDVERTPPDPDYPSGILSIVIHQINNLERQNLGGASGKDREGQAGQDTDDPSEQSSNLPSAYCEIIINDDLIYKTRVKQYTTMPFFEAGTERFIRDWQNTIVRLVVRDSRLREKDPILGIVNLKLSDIFQEGSEVTRMYSITEGIGFGRMNVSILFRGINVKLPRKELGWETATAEILSPLMLQLQPDYADLRTLTTKKLTISTTDSKERVPAPSNEIENGVISWDIDKIRLPVYNRYSSCLMLELGGGASVPPIKNGAPEALGLLWLKDLVDDEEVEVEIPVVVGKDLRTLRQNVLNDFTAATHDYKVIGHFKTRIKLDSGLDEDHEKYAQTQARRHAYEAYDHIEGEGIIAEKNSHANDDGVIDKDEKKAIERAHKRQLANRQRGINGFRPYRTAKWMKEGLLNRIKPKKASAKRDPAVQSEA
ncbi:hypothetical protein M422DRAFT_225382 [Sphaerobolus stellatus SS14]|nr:hypothetical protein M422DRAFT_225382 [Sphaerobolus stellatus SS14]